MKDFLKETVYELKGNYNLIFTFQQWHSRLLNQHFHLSPSEQKAGPSPL
jgi:hypothetical protein